MVFVTVRLYDSTGSYASQKQQERLLDNGFRTRNFDRRMYEVDYKWKTFWQERNAQCKRPPTHEIYKKWTIEISGLDERFSAAFLEKFDSLENSYPRAPLKSSDMLSYYVTICTDPNLARDGNVMPISVAAYYVNKLEETGLKCTYTKHICPDNDNQSPSMIWTLTEHR